MGRAGLSLRPAAHHELSKADSGKGVCVAPAAQQEASRTGVKENRWCGVGPCARRAARCSGVA